MFGKIGRADTATDPAPFSMAETTIRLSRAPSGPGSSHARWYSSWAPEPLKRAAAARLARAAAPMTTAELVEQPGRGTPAAGLDQRLDRAGARAHGHDGDGRAHAGRHPHRRARSGAARRARAAPCEAAVRSVPGTRSAVFEALGGETPAGFELDAAGAGALRRRPGARPRGRRPLATGGAIGEIAGDRADARSAPLPRAAGARRARGCTSRRRTCSATRRCARAATATGQPVPLALARAADVRRSPGDAAHGARRAVRLRLRRPRRRGPTSTATSSARARAVDGALARGRRTLGPASASSGPGSTSCSSPDSGGWR